MKTDFYFLHIKDINNHATNILKLESKITSPILTII